MSDVKLSANAQKIMDLTEGLTILELADLVSAMEEKFGVSAAAPVAAAGAGAVADEAEEKSTYNVVLTSAGAAKIGVIKVLRDLTGLGLAEAKAIADNGGNVKENVSKADADSMKKALEEAGASVELK
ncbi:MAG: 50S ribosomal protein L7/L12 [Candidatus Gracilibacteria bacterium]|nr:50S ribosomal protein L7/L12 [Candidatus Gracilibacteria bacterium]